MNIKKIILLIVITLLFSCTDKKPIIFISGTVENPVSDSVSFQIIEKDTTVYAVIDKSKNYFEINLELDTASYVYFIHGDESSAMYLYGDENITMSVNTKLFDESIKYKGSPTSNYLAKKYLIEENADFFKKIYNTTWEKFEPILEKHNNIILKELQAINNEVFVKKEKEIIQQMSEYFERVINEFNKLPKPGAPAINFTYKDKIGNNYSLSDYKGTLVYVDVWATWCGPCKKEIPFLKKLETDYKDKELTFLSVSVDENRKAWEKMLEEKNMGGIQLIADKGWNSEIMQSYAINGIPRFMLFDKNGNIISLMAPRPSSTNIRELIDNNL